MQKRYTQEQRRHALQRLAEHSYSYTAAGAELGIPPSTLHRWQRLHEAQLLASVPTIRLLHETLGRAALRVARAIEYDAPLDEVPLHQLGSVLAVLVDRFLKLKEVIPESESEEEKVVRLEYAYNGSIHNTPPWAEADSGEPQTLYRSRLREAFWQNGRGPDADGGRSAGLWPEDLVAGTHLSDGDAGLARFQDDPPERTWYDDG